MKAYFLVRKWHETFINSSYISTCQLKDKLKYNVILENATFNQTQT